MATKAALVFHASAIRRLLQDARDAAPVKVEDMEVVTFPTSHACSPTPLNLAALAKVWDSVVALATSHPLTSASIVLAP